MKFRYLIINEDDPVKGTNDEAVAKYWMQTSLVVDCKDGCYLDYDGNKDIQLESRKCDADFESDGDEE